MPHARRVDNNHVEIKAVVRAAGYFLADTSKLGDGFPDLVIADKAGRVALLFEVKTNETPVQPAEIKFMLQIVQPVYRIVTTGEQVLEIMNQLEA